MNLMNRNKTPGSHTVSASAAARRTVLAAFLSLGLLIAAPACTGQGGPPPPPPATNTTGGSSSTGDLSVVPRVVKEVEPSVVTIRTPEGVGSGVVYQGDGIILTDAHVVVDQQKQPFPELKIVFADGTQASATVVGADNPTDVAVVKADRGNLPAAKFSSAVPVVGQLAVVIGSPLGLEQTVTAGIVSGLHRNMPPSEGAPQGLLDLIQTDAPISPGNSGGPVVNGNSEVIGLAEAYLPPSSGAVAIGFVTPTATVLDVAEQILKTGVVKHAALGIVPTDLTPEIAQRFNLPTSSGALVVEVATEGPADKAGMQPGDIITQFAGQNLETVTDLLAELRKKNPGEQAEVVLRRGQDTRTVNVTLGDSAQR
ncbi:MAG: signal protein [Arthrobacter sp.]|nr:signal protein [Arthrobacter sp.]